MKVLLSGWHGHTYKGTKMINLKTWLDVVEYRITDSNKYMWNCYGLHAHTFDSWDGDHDGSSFSITFDTKTQTVYEVAAHDFRNSRAYRMINPVYQEAHRTEVAARNVSDEAWEDVAYTDLEVDEDWLEKARAIFAGDKYDTRVLIPLEFSDEELLTYMKAAHDRDMTFNAFVEMAISEAIAHHIPTLTETV